MCVYICRYVYFRTLKHTLFMADWYRFLNANINYDVLQCNSSALFSNKNTNQIWFEWCRRLPMFRNRGIVKQCCLYNWFMFHIIYAVNSLYLVTPNGAEQYRKLVQWMAWRLSGTKPWPRLMLTCYRLQCPGININEIYSEVYFFLLNCIQK